LAQYLACSIELKSFFPIHLKTIFGFDRRLKIGVTFLQHIDFKEFLTTKIAPHPPHPAQSFT